MLTPMEVYPNNLVAATWNFECTSQIRKPKQIKNQLLIGNTPYL